MPDSNLNKISYRLYDIVCIFIKRTYCSISSTLTVERVVSRLIALVIGKSEANAISITIRSKNLRRPVKNAFLGPENGPKSLKSIFL